MRHLPVFWFSRFLVDSEVYHLKKMKSSQKMDGQNPTRMGEYKRG